MILWVFYRVFYKKQEKKRPTLWNIVPSTRKIKNRTCKIRRDVVELICPFERETIRPWRSWISQWIPIPKAGGSNPSGRAIWKKSCKPSVYAAFSFYLGRGIPSKTAIYPELLRLFLRVGYPRYLSPETLLICSNSPIPSASRILDWYSRCP